MFDDLAHYRGQGDLIKVLRLNPPCHSRRGARLACRGKGTQAFRTAPFLTTWVPFPSRCFRSTRPGMTDVCWALRYLRDINLDFQFKMRETVAHDAGALFPLRIKGRLFQRRCL